MKKLLLLIIVFIGICPVSTQAQQTIQDSCAEIKAMYDQALYYLDSIVGNQHALQKQLDSLRRELNKSKADVRNQVKDKTQTKADLDAARKLIAEQMEQIKKLDAEVKRLSAKLSKQKGT